jgi:hypothetical protein
MLTMRRSLKRRSEAARAHNLLNVVVVSMERREKIDR